MPGRTFGWVQDPGKISNLRKTVEIFDTESRFHGEMKPRIQRLVSKEDGYERLISALDSRPLHISYSDLVGKAFYPRASARCNGIIQAAIPGQKRSFISDWPADNFIRWAHALRFIEYFRDADNFGITKSGLLFSCSVINSDEEYNLLSDALLSYPPVSRIINLLAEAANKGMTLTKFELGRNLGFIGEKGFTTINQNFFAKEYCLTENRLTESPLAKEDIAEIKQVLRSMKSDWEGDSDKYARMICSWLSQLKHPWIRKKHKKIRVDIGNESFSHKTASHELTAEGFKVRKRSSGASSRRRVKKFIPFEMLCTKGEGRNYLRNRRARIICAINKRPRTPQELTAALKKDGIEVSESDVKSDIVGLCNIGLTIENQREKYHCRDEIVGLEIPDFPAGETQPGDILRVVEKCRAELILIPHEYLVLIELAFDRRSSRIFEIKTIELLTEQCEFGGSHLGGANRPDGVVFTDDYGVIIDTKSYASGFNIPIAERDKMTRYVREAAKKPKSNKTQWWNHFPPELRKILFLFVSGKFGGQFREQLQALSESADGACGGAISAYALLRTADRMASKEMSVAEFKDKISSLDEIVA